MALRLGPLSDPNWIIGLAIRTSSRRRCSSFAWKDYISAGGAIAKQDPKLGVEVYRGTALRLLAQLHNTAPDVLFKRNVRVGAILRRRAFFVACDMPGGPAAIVGELPRVGP